MSNFIIPLKSHNIQISSALEQMFKEQDYICQGIGLDAASGESFQWTMLNDGHGTNSCINFIRSIPDAKKSELISQTDPIAALAKYIDSSNCVRLYEISGATAVITKCYSNRAEVITCGDSQAVVFKNGQIVHITKEHNCNNEAERIRVLEAGRSFNKSSNIQVISHNEIKKIPAEYVIFANPMNFILACTQALGHNSITGYAPDKYVVEFEDDANYKIVLGSDGLFDMTMLDDESDIAILSEYKADEIALWCKKRWLQTWYAHSELQSNNKVSFQYEKEQCDDISVATIEIMANL